MDGESEVISEDLADERQDIDGAQGGRDAEGGRYANENQDAGGEQNAYHDGEGGADHQAHEFDQVYDTGRATIVDGENMFIDVENGYATKSGGPALVQDDGHEDNQPNGMDIDAPEDTVIVEGTRGVSSHYIAVAFTYTSLFQASPLRQKIRVDHFHGCHGWTCRSDAAISTCLM